MADYIDFAGDMLSVNCTGDRKWVILNTDAYNDDGVHLDREQTLRVVAEICDIVDHVLPEPESPLDPNQFKVWEVWLLVGLVALVSATLGVLLS
jgi:hypothetical protein